MTRTNFRDFSVLILALAEWWPRRVMMRAPRRRRITKPTVAPMMILVLELIEVEESWGTNTIVVLVVLVGVTLPAIKKSTAWPPQASVTDLLPVKLNLKPAGPSHESLLANAGADGCAANRGGPMTKNKKKPSVTEASRRRTFVVSIKSVVAVALEMAVIFVPKNRFVDASSRVLARAARAAVCKATTPFVLLTSRKEARGTLKIIVTRALRLSLYDCTTHRVKASPKNPGGHEHTKLPSVTFAEQRAFSPQPPLLTTQ